MLPNYPKSQPCFNEFEQKWKEARVLEVGSEACFSVEVVITTRTLKRRK